MLLARTGLLQRQGNSELPILCHAIGRVDLKQLHKPLSENFVANLCVRMKLPFSDFRKVKWCPCCILLTLIEVQAFPRGSVVKNPPVAKGHFSLSCIGEGNGNPLQCSCLENPRDGGAWWAAVYGITQSRTRLKRLSSSSSNVREVDAFLRQARSPEEGNGHPLQHSCLENPVDRGAWWDTVLGVAKSQTEHLHTQHTVG